MPNIELSELDEELRNLFSEIDIFQAVTPVNEAEQRRRFLEGEIDNPDFEYMEKDVSEIKERLEGLDVGKAPEGLWIYERAIKSLESMVEVVENLGQREKVIEASSDLFDMPRSDTVDVAKHILRAHPPIDREGIHSTERIKEEFEKTFDQLGLEWDVKTREKRTIYTKASERTIYVPSKSMERKFTDNELKRLPLHEIGVHAIRAENGYRQNFSILGEGMGGHHLAEEGLTTFLEETSGLASIKTMRKYAARVVAVVSMLKEEEFRKTFQRLRGFDLKEEQAWQTTMRAYRAGGFCKDHIYLEGNRRVWDYVEDGGRLSGLFIGKVSIEGAGRLQKTCELSEPAYSPVEIQEGLKQRW